MAHILPAFQPLWDNYPPEEDTAAVKKAIGGHVDAAWITNTCTVRLSRALNYSKSPVPGGFPGLSTVSGADGKRYAYRVREMRKYMEFQFGQATVKVGGGADGKAGVAGKRGIIMFDVHGWNDATGHFTIWNGALPRHGEYFDKASAVLLWVCTLPRPAEARNSARRTHPPTPG